MSTLSLRKVKHDSSSVDNIITNSDGGVGIGGIDPSTLPAFIDHAIKVQNGGGLGIQSANATDNRWIFFGNGTTNGDVQRAGIVNQGSDQSLALATAGTQRLIVDASGRVTTPYQPAFDAYGTVGNFSVTTEVAIPLNSTTYNVGNHYNTSNYRFTAPVAGMYFFRAHTYKQASGNASRLRFYKNAGDVRVYQYISASDTYTHAITGIISLAVGDYVTCTFNSDGAGTNIYLADNHTNFSGYLLG